MFEIAELNVNNDITSYNFSDVNKQSEHTSLLMNSETVKQEHGSDKQNRNKSKKNNKKRNNKRKKSGSDEGDQKRGKQRLDSDKCQQTDQQPYKAQCTSDMAPPDPPYVPNMSIQTTPGQFWAQPLYQPPPPQSGLQPIYHTSPSPASQHPNQSILLDIVARLEQIELSLKKVDKLDEIQIEVGGINAKISNIDKRMKEAEGKVTKMEEGMNFVSSQYDDLMKKQY